MRVLFVCLGNICRSPTAEAVVGQLASQRLRLTTDSAGTSDWHVGEPPYGAMQQAALARGYDMSGLRARQFCAEDFTAFDLLIAMDAGNLSNMERLRPQGNVTPIKLFTEFAPDWHMDEVPDPYYNRDFDGVLDLIEACARGLLAELA